MICRWCAGICARRFVFTMATRIKGRSRNCSRQNILASCWAWLWNDMFEALREILAPDFLLRNAIYATLLVGLVCPAVGCFLILRRLVFLGVALPQVASAGVALTLSVHIWTAHDSAFHDISESHLGGSLFVTLLTIIILACIERWGRRAGEGGLGALYVLTTAASILIL